MLRKFSRANRLAVLLVPTALAVGASAALAGNVGVDINLHLGNQPQQVIVPAPQPAPVIVPAPPAAVVVPAPPATVVIENDVDFVYPSQLGFYVAVGVPYDLFYLRNNYYLHRDGRWFMASGSHGPWYPARYRELPPRLRRYDMAKVRAYRNAEYDVYRRDRDHYRGRHFMTAREAWKEQKRADKEYRKEARREEKEYRKEMKREEKEERKHRGWEHD
ncbi:hypothetical protein [Geomonas sp.]|uniref:hypothetical protein n=1 Tax=Geomonas sp. TaxID=2651584 RepID=UPI002B4933A8|nr:hypothetical protein [Geomonas sp.]HJV34827.1 hypothetical protein [Geomonas sp.]